MNMRKYLTLTLAAFSLFFSGCTTVQEKPLPQSTTPPSLKETSQLTTWQLSGAIAAKQNRKAWTASLTWEQFNQQHYRLSFFGPMGGHAVTVEKNKNQVRYQEGNLTEQAQNIDSLIYKKTGQTLPLTHLFYWVRGLKSPGEAVEIRDTSGRLIQLKQAGYTLSYTNYRLIHGYYLPTKIRIDHQRNGWLKLVIRDWVVPSST